MDPAECSGHSHDHHSHHGGSSDELGLSLRPCMDLDRVVCYNEEVVGSGRAILKLHQDRLTLRPSLRSPDDDAELLLYIPFTESVTIQSISVRSGSSTWTEGGGGGGVANNNNNNNNTAPPRRIKLYTNRDDLDFETVRELEPHCKLELLPPHHFAEGSIDYPLRPAGRFQSVSSLAIYFENNYSSVDDDTDDHVMPTEITFVGLKGKGTNVKRRAVQAVYETRGMKKDHQVPGADYGTGNFIGDPGEGL